ncbi:MAG: insulinase family protein, partial [Acidobacteriota bacterium]|nr:insulinase family protein [Acidobacteriota bacterium]
VVLDNGMVVLLLEDHELPLVDAIAVTRSGGRLDPPAQAGLASLAVRVMRSGGTEAMSGDALDELLEDRAASLEVRVDDTSLRAGMKALTKDWPEVLRVLADVLRRPAFDPRQIEVARGQAIATVARRNDNAERIAMRELKRVVYGADSPYARTPTFATLAGLRRDDLVAWHRQNLHPERIVLGLVGDFDARQALARVREAFGDWRRGPARQEPDLPYRHTPSPGVYYVEKDDMAQSQLAIGHLGLLKSDPDYYALEVLNELFGGGFTSRLTAHLRTGKGLTYGVLGQIGSGWDQPGLAMLWMSTKTATTGAGIAALLAEAHDLQARPPSDDEIALAKRSILNSFVFRLSSKLAVLEQQLSTELYGYPRDWLARYRTGVLAVRPDAVRAAARHLRPADFAILVVGPAKGQDRPLDDFGRVTTLDVTLPPPPAAFSGAAQR